MREQATALTQETEGLLRGEVRTSASRDNELFTTLSIIVPALNNYKYDVATYIQPITLFPGTLISTAAKTHAYPVDADTHYV